MESSISGKLGSKCLPLSEQPRWPLSSNYSWWGRKQHQSFTSPAVFFWMILFHPSSVLLVWACRSQCACSEIIMPNAFSETALCWPRTLKRSWKLGSHKQTAGYCFQTNCSKWELLHLLCSFVWVFLIFSVLFIWVRCARVQDLLISCSCTKEDVWQWVTGAFASKPF